MKYMLVLLLILIAGGSYFLYYKYSNRSDAEATIIYVPGIKTDAKYSDPWKKYLEQHYPNADLKVIEGRYDYSEYGVLQNKKEEILVALQGAHNKTIVILTHSYGGILAKSAIDSVQTDNVTLITMAGPFDPSLTDLTESKQEINFEYDKPSYTTYTYGGRFDTVVEPEKATLPDVPHTNLLSNHITFIFPWLPMLGEIRKTVHRMIIAE